MLDAGIGHGYADFEGIQLRTIAKGQPLERLWEAGDGKSSADREKKLLERPAYAKLDQCGKVSFADGHRRRERFHSHQPGSDMSSRIAGCSRRFAGSASSSGCGRFACSVVTC
jgi:hypothetical protein